MKNQNVYSGKITRNLFTALVIAACGLTQRLDAQIIPGGSIITQVVNPLSAASMDDVVSNTDMLEDPNGTIKAFVYSAYHPIPTTPPAPQQYSTIGEIVVVDYGGNRWSTSLPSYGMQPDVALANAQDADGNDHYQLLVTYFQGNSTTATGDAVLEIYDLQNVGTGGFSAVLRSGFPVNLDPTGAKCAGFPHIDMWSDANTPAYGWPSMHQFAVTWSDAAGNHQLLVSDVNTFSPLAPPALLPGNSNVFMPDLACLTDTRTGDQYVEFAFGFGVGTPVQVTGGGALQYCNYNVTSGSLSSAATLDSRGCYAPKIEAMSQYNQASGDARYQVAASVYVGGLASWITAVLGYNDLTAGPTDMSSLLAPLYPTVFWAPNHYTAQGACVAAGTGSGTIGSNIGNNQYTVGFYPWNHDSIYARNVDVATGLLNIPSQCYLVNDPNTVVDYPWDYNQSMAVTNCSNTGRDLVTMWFDGTNVNFKHSMPNVMAFRQGPKGRQQTPAIYPVPASSSVQLQGLAEQSAYRIYDAAGRGVLSGWVGAGEAVDLGTLAPGVYSIGATDGSGNPVTLKFTKL